MKDKPTLYPLFQHMRDEHGLVLVESEILEIEQVEKQFIKNSHYGYCQKLVIRGEIKRINKVKREIEKVKTARFS